ncbi:MAG TPA: DinB family protein [Cyclobacteriaceae bacterium]|nr:DinB family protein [Cyclobacteriaceae bacterium]
MTKPDIEGAPVYYRTYLEYVKDYDLIEAFKYSGDLTQALISSLPEDMGQYRYEEGKWSIKEVVCHVMDVERIFAYRALRFARNDNTALPGFEENDYAPEANAHERSFIRLAEETARLRLATIDLFESFTPAMMKRTGMANKTELSVLNLGYIISGHESHHRKILTERYLNV